nr:MAG: ORF1 [TTV-like mini virus]
MPYYYRRRNRRRRYWRRRFRPWGFRGYFRRRPRWRRQRRVRRKLSKIKIQQYQPETIHKSKIKGLFPLIICNAKRLSNNFRQYEHSIINALQPGGGGFSITKFSLDGLFEQHQLVRNWWTKANTNLPLVRYTGCKLKLYRSENVDYVVSYFTCFPMIATLQLYNSCQPSIQLMNPDSIKVPSKRTNPKGKNYKIVKIRPPAQLTNKWYFTADLAKTGLLLLTTTITSFDHYYISSTSENNNIGFRTLNTTFFNMHNFDYPTNYYKPWTQGTQEKTLWAMPHAHVGEQDVTKYYMKDLIFLGQSKKYTPGDLITDIQYLENPDKWGNVFYHQYINEDVPLLVSTTQIHQLKTTYNNINSTKLKNTDFQFTSQPLTIQCRYNPDRDTGKDNLIYLLPKVRDTHNSWNPTDSATLKHWGFPLWLLPFGWLDFLRKSSAVQHIDRDWLIVLQSHFIEPELQYYVPIDQDFLDNKSPYTQEPNDIYHDDLDSWNPQVTYQHQTLEHFVETGPGIAKLGTNKSVECKCDYTFYFKFGGCPPKMETITDPTKLPTYPIPNNNTELYSFQNPNIAPETYLYQFDVRKDIITEAAAKRIKKDWGTEPFVQSITGRMQPATEIPEALQDSSETEDHSEKEEETLYDQLKQCRRKRKRLQLKLLSLMNKSE